MSVSNDGAGGEVTQIRMTRRQYSSCLAVVVAVASLISCTRGETDIRVSRSTGTPPGALVLDLAKRSETAVFRVDRSRYDFRAVNKSSFLLEGWARPEVSADGDRSFAWATSRQASVRLAVFDTDDRWLHFRSRPSAPVSDEGQAAAVSVNGHGIGGVEFISGGFKDYSLPVPDEALVHGDNVISFSFASTGVPAEVGTSTRDTRSLAAAFDFVALTNSRQFPSSVDRPERRAGLGPNDDRIRQPSGTESAFRIRVPEEGSLEFTVEAGQQRSRDRGPSPLAELAIRRAGSEHIIFNEPVGASDARWRADLSSAAGEEIELVFRTRGDGDQDEVAEWVRPHLYGNVDVQTNVVLIVIDTLRADHLGSYGGESHTPNLDALAASGVRFENAYSHVPITLPSHASMFTSLLPTEHGARNNGQVLSDDHLTLPELLRDTSRHTSAFVSLGVLSANFGISQGFNEYHDRFGLNWWKTAEAVNADVLPWLDQNQSEPFFLFVHYSDPHEPYGAPHGGYPSIQATVEGRSVATFPADGGMVAFSLDVPAGRSEVSLSAVADVTEWPVRINQLRTSESDVTATCAAGCSENHPRPHVTEYVSEFPATVEIVNSSDSSVSVEISMRVAEKTSSRVLRQRYREEVEYVDGEIGRLLSTLRSVTSNETLVILTSDHGEGLGEHGPPGHVTRLYDPQLRVPLVFAWPGRLPAGVVVDDPVSHVDLLPTVVDLFNIPDAGYRSGRSLVPALTGEADPAAPETVVVAETFRPEAEKDRRAIIASGHKLVSTPVDQQEELYDLVVDPRELNNLAQEEPEITSRLRRLLFERMVTADDRGTLPSESELTQEQIERLRSLGYLR